MTDAPAVLGGWYTDVKYLNKIGVARITIEMPKDLWEENQGVLGVPPSLDGAKKYVALSRITEDAFKTWASPLARAVPEKPEAVAEPVKAKPLRSNLAAILCKENEDFQKWLVDRYWAGKEAVGDYDSLLKRALQIASKTDLDKDDAAAERFDRLTTDFAYRNVVRA